MYERASLCVRTVTDNIEDFSIEVGLYQGSSLYPYLFALVMYKLTFSLQYSLRCVLFVYDVTLIDSTRE